MKKLTLALIAISTLLPTLAQSTTIELDWGVSIPASYPGLNINVGDTVRWTWVDPFAVSHNVVIEDDTMTPIFSTPLSSGAGTMVEYTFNNAGDFTFYCAPHSGSMNGSLTVNPVPVPAAAWLFGSGLIGLAGIARKRRSL